MTGPTMSTEHNPAGAQATPAETTELLRQILSAVEARSGERKRWVEITCALVLALATTASAWCAYQATLWSGVQTFRLAAAARAGREAMKNSVEGMQFRAFDGTMFIHYMEARAQGRKDLEEFVYNRFRPEMKLAVDAWLKTDPFNNPNAPPHPLKMQEYVVAVEIEAGKQTEMEKQKAARAEEANQNSDRYVLLTVMFASVLFFAGITGTIDIPWLRKTLGILALVFFVGTVIFLATMPICRE
jgi:hypothetical protein